MLYIGYYTAWIVISLREKKWACLSNYTGAVWSSLSQNMYLRHLSGDMLTECWSIYRLILCQYVNWVSVTGHHIIQADRSLVTANIGQHFVVMLVDTQPTLNRHLNSTVTLWSTIGGILVDCWWYIRVVDCCFCWNGCHFLAPPHYHRGHERRLFVDRAQTGYLSNCCHFEYISNTTWGLNKHWVVLGLSCIRP